MRLPIPRSRLTQLTLVGAILTAAVAAGLLAPGVFGIDQQTGGGTTADLGADAPTPNDDFSPSVADGGEEDEYEEHDEYEEDDEDDEDEDEEYEDEEYEAYDRIGSSVPSSSDVAPTGGN
ncbi:hypothetical protein [Salinibaculum rarum]|uniref:hypothetical protein n=1 Tax=Salinibaculum rarum TaxID=3058903 RepID=UPI0026603192|nr:hypothetical protein [Salinibaculum sp. KK48]